MIIRKIEVRKLSQQSSPPCASGLVLLSPIPAIPETVSAFTKLRRLRREVTTWVKAGAKLVPKEVRAERLAICVACEFYNPRGNLGLGECRFPGCGCSKVKLALATSKCPHVPPKWPVWTPPS